MLAFFESPVIIHFDGIDDEGPGPTGSNAFLLIKLEQCFCGRFRQRVVLCRRRIAELRANSTVVEAVSVLHSTPRGFNDSTRSNHHYPNRGVPVARKPDCCMRSTRADFAIENRPHLGCVAVERFFHFSASRRRCSCCVVSMPAIIGAWAEVARHRRHPICSPRYRLGSHRRRLIARRYRTRTPPPPRQHFPPFRMFCPTICPRRSCSFRIKTSIDCCRRCSLSRSDVGERCPSPMRIHASSESNRLP
jgi:hypothetical protein